MNPPITWHPSPNFGPRRDDAVIDHLILHYTGMQSANAALERLCDPVAQVSAHYFVDEDGTVLQLVAEENRAWHAGVGAWRGCIDINSASIGIELVNPGHEFGYRPFTREQMDALTALAGDIVTRHRIVADRILGHSDVAPDRKTDPGELFDWRHLAEAGIGTWVDESALEVSKAPALGPGDEGVAVKSLRADLAHWGYDLAVDGAFDEKLICVVTAFQRHWRPKRVDGVADSQTRAILRRLIELYHPYDVG